MLTLPLAATIIADAMNDARNAERPPDEREHLPSASASARIHRCPASHEFSIGLQGIQTAEMREWRAAGNRIHDWLCNQLGPSLSLNHGPFKSLDRPLTDDEQDVADRCINQARELKSRIFDGISSRGIRLIQEQRMWLYAVPTTAQSILRKRFSGKADAVFIWRDAATGLYRCLIIDFKTNRGDQEESTRNAQLRSLAVLLCITLNWKVSSIDVAIVQPLVSGDPTPCCYELPELHIAHNMLLADLARCEAPEPEFHPGHEQCKFCPGKFKCPALQDLRDSLEVFRVGATAAELAAWLDKAEPLVHAYDEARAGLREHLNLNPDAVPNWELKPNAGDRAITDPRQAHDTLVAANLMDTATFLQKCVKVGIGTLTKGLVDYNQLKPKHKADHIINTVLAPFLTREPKNPSLVRK